MSGASSARQGWASPRGGVLRLAGRRWGSGCPRRGPRAAVVSADAVGEGGLDRGAGVQRAEHDDRADRGAGELGRDVRGDAGEAQHADVEPQAGVAGRLELRAAVVAQAEVEALALRGPRGRVGVALELVADGGADEVGAVGVEPLPDQEVDAAEVDVAEVDGDLLAVGGLGPRFLDVADHLLTILLPSVWMVSGAGRGFGKGPRPG